MEGANMIKNQALNRLDSKRLMEYTYEITKKERLSGSKAELESFRYIEQQMNAFGLKTTFQLEDAFISLPIQASLIVNDKEYECITHSMTSSTPEEGINADLLYVEGSEELINLGREVMNKALVFQGFAGRNQVELASQMGASACIFINGEHLHNMILSKVWGNPTPDNIDILPQIPVVSIDKYDGEDILACAQRQQNAYIFTAVDTKWTKIPHLMAEINGKEEPEKFVLLSGHVDSWHFGAMDNGTANATMMEIGRVLAQEPLYRSLKISFWSGHSHGRYAGSASYFDQNFQNIHDHCVVHINIDSIGARGASIVTEGNIMPLTKKLADNVVKKHTNQQFKGKPFGRNGDQSFWGAGVPSAFMGFSGQPMEEKPDRLDTYYMIHQFGNGPESAGFGWWWHTKHDTFDKVNETILARDAKVFLDYTNHFCVTPILPIDLRAGFNELQMLMAHYEKIAEPQISFSDINNSLNKLADYMEQLYALCEKKNLKDSPSLNEAIQTFSRVIVRLRQVGPSPFEPDYAISQAPIPLLSDIDQLSTVNNSDSMYLMVVTKARRRTNQVSFILRKAIEEVECKLSDV